MVQRETWSRRQIFTQYATFYALSSNVKGNQEKIVDQVETFRLLANPWFLKGILPVIYNFFNQSFTFIQ